ncbi:MAG: hypothetical protein L0177_01835 [Chloroflexi bacterium]|nr:hypothetical protein [Chloroflexota bacterium]
MRAKLMALTIAALAMVALACGQQAPPSAVGSVITPIEEIGNFMGEQVTTCGQVIEGRYQIFERGSPTYLYMDEKFPFHKMSVVVMERHREAFPEELETHYNGEHICVAGRIQGYPDQPEMLIESPAQLEVQETTNVARRR